MRLLKLFPLVAAFLFAVTCVKADQAPEADLSIETLEPQQEATVDQDNVAWRSSSSTKQQPVEAEETLYSDDTDKNYDQGQPLKEEQLMSAYNSPARIDVKGSWDVFLGGSYIYWQTKEGGLNTALIIPANTATEYHKVGHMNFDYKSGFKVHLGTNFDHDGWLSMVEYIRLHTRHKASLNAPTGGHLDPFFIETVRRGGVGYASAVATTWHLNYDMINLEFARPFYVGTNLSFKPHLGLTGGWINQRIKQIGTFLTDTFTLYSKLYGKSWIIGPRLGIDTNWMLGAGFSIIADAALDIAYQKVKTTFKEQSAEDAASTQLDRYLREKIGQITPALEATAGLSWGTYFDNNKWHFSLATVYDFLYYFNQNHMTKNADLAITSVNTKPADLILHGLTVTARLDF
ncbi:MAG: Lpg1974 family pore-forming outer membrane protein [Parachlamydiales bacterium]|jgi:hypothetical protein